MNDVPHLGHAYTTIVADALARFHRARGVRTFMLTGTDEHGQKIEEAATRKGKQPIDLADEVVERFRETWKRMEIANDDFIRTTQDRHKAVVTEVWRRIAANGDITLGSYDGWYCVGCEGYYPESQLDEGNLCPTHKTPARWVSEPSYFFRMSKYQDRLLEHIEKHPDFIRPENYKNEIVSFVSSGLRDLSVSRTTFKWGIPVPDDPAHVIYVWIDALTNYLSALGGLDSEPNSTFWPADCHLIGKDILRFHAVYWPCMLMSAGLPLPKTIFSHGWWTVRGEKISKSMPATRVDPNLLADDIGADALRYFLLREVPLGLDGDFSYEALLGRYNSDLANDLGNLLNRTLTMAAKFCDRRVPPTHADLAEAELHAGLRETATTCARDAAALFEDYAPSRALESIWKLVRETNRYVDTSRPWALAKDEGKRAELEHTVRSFLEAIYWIARMVAPVMPVKSAEILAQLGFADEAISESLNSWPDPERFNRDLPDGLVLGRGKPLFPRLDEKQQAALLARWIPDDAKAPTKEPAASTSQAKKEPEERPLISFDDFQKLDLRVAQIRTAEPVPKTKKLLRLELDLGDLGARTVVAGIAEAYEPADLVGRKVVFLANLQPATIRGVRSEGMILAAGDKKVVGLSALDRDLPPGTVIR